MHGLNRNNILCLLIIFTSHYNNGKQFYQQAMNSVAIKIKKCIRETVCNTLVVKKNE